MKQVVLLILAVFGLQADVAWAGDTAGSADQPPCLRLRAGIVETAEVSVGPSGFRGENPRNERMVMQLDGPITPARRRAYERAGIRLGDYLPDRAYVVELEGVDPTAARSLPGVRWIGLYRPEWKLDPAIGRSLPALDARDRSERSASGTDPALAGRRRLLRAGLVQVVVSLFTGEDPGRWAGELKGLDGVEVLATQSSRSGRGLIDAVVPLRSLHAVSALPGVQFVEEAPVGTLRNDTTRWVVQSNVSLSTPLWTQGLHGEDQIAGLIDSEVWEEHCAFVDTEPIGPTHRKIIAHRGDPGNHSHGTHTAGTLVGDQGSRGAADPVDGIAFASKVSFSLYWDVSATPSLLYPDLAAAHVDGARVHSNSWGDDTTDEYTTWCEQADRFSYDFEESLVVFAATNTATLKTPENAKNILAVGATYQAPNQENKYKGGTGPTFDGRRKPEVFAPGSSIVSASAYVSCGTSTLGGASMAAPAVAGVAVLVRQYFTEGLYPSGVPVPGDALTPSGALLKSTVINSATDMTGVAGYPSDDEGWGRIRAIDTLYFAGDDRKLFVADVFNTNGLSTAEFETYHVNVTTNAEPLKITLVFTDPPGTVGAADPVVNDLDLVVTGPLSAGSLGDSYFGNNFSAGQSAAGGARDDRNNVEQIHLLAPGPGVYTLEIQGTAVNQGKQGYALVVSGAVEAVAPPLGNGDHNFDSDVDLADYGELQMCFTGVDQGPIHASCQPLDLDGDRDVDAADMAAFTAVMLGP
ncbi:MAG: S8 family serine peptidase [bacterium]|nr:S8 family serine peptidase [bacterium]